MLSRREEIIEKLAKSKDEHSPVSKEYIKKELETLSDSDLETMIKNLPSLTLAQRIIHAVKNMFA